MPNCYEVGGEDERMRKDAKIYVAGHRGLVGSAIVRALEEKGYHNLIYRTSSELDLRQQSAVQHFFAEEKPDYVFLAAAKVGGILANSTYPAQFLYDNLMIQANVIEAAYRNKIDKLLFLGSTCIYPKLAPQPLQETYLLTGPLEETNEAYAIAKISGIKLCGSYNREYGTNYLSLMPTNLYGPNDNFDLGTSHVMPALMRKIHEAKMMRQSTVTVWGSGNPLREFLHVDDMAQACIFVTEHVKAEKAGEFINIGTGVEITIRDLALLLCEVIGFEGKLIFDPSKPDGTPRKLTDVSKIHHLGWKHRIELREGIQDTYQWYLKQMEEANE